jgi:hypothetical protein
MDPARVARDGVVGCDWSRSEAPRDRKNAVRGLITATDVAATRSPMGERSWAPGAAQAPRAVLQPRIWWREGGSDPGGGSTGAIGNAVLFIDWIAACPSRTRVLVRSRHRTQNCRTEQARLRGASDAGCGPHQPFERAEPGVRPLDKKGECSSGGRSSRSARGLWGGRTSSRVPRSHAFAERIGVPVRRERGPQVARWTLAGQDALESEASASSTGRRTRRSCRPVGRLQRREPLSKQRPVGSETMTDPTPIHPV